MKRAEPGWVVVTLAGFAALLGSFLPFYTYTAGVDVTVWSRGLFPTAALIPLLGLVIGLQALFVLIVGHEPRSPFLNFTWEQVRLAVSAFMILLALSYLLQDRAGGSLGSGYLVLSLASLVTFAGGVMTRRAQLARGGEAPARKRQLQVRPALATVNRAGAGLARSVGALGRSAARGTAGLGRSVGAHLGFGEPNAAKQQVGTLDAKLEGGLLVQPPPPRIEKPTETTAEPSPAPPPPPPPPPETLVEEPIAATPDETDDAEPVEANDEKGAEEKVADEATEELATEPARVATLSAVPPETDPDQPAVPDGDTPPPPRESPDGSDKVAASKPRRKRQPAKKKVEKNVEKKVQEVEEKEPAGTGKEPQSPAAPG